MNRLELLLDIKAANKPPRKVNVRADLPAAQLIAAIRDHFNLDGSYELRLENGQNTGGHCKGTAHAGTY